VIYKAKVDWWIGSALVFGIAAPTVSGVIRHEWPAVTLSGLFAAFVLIVIYPQSYKTADDALRIHHGVMTDTIPWPSVSGVRATSDSRSSYALSMDRVLIEYGGKSVIIAPEDEVRFFEDVAPRCPQLSRRGMDLAIALGK